MNALLRLLMFALALSVAQARTDGPDDEYLRLYDLIQQGDTLNQKGETAKAATKYRQALAGLAKFKTNYPAWNTKLVAARLAYLAQKLSPSGSAPTTASSSSSSQVKLLEAGAEPRKTLRLHPTVGQKQTLVMTMKMTIDTKMGDMQNIAMKLPPMKMTTDITISAVAPGGDISYQTTLSEASVEDDPAAMPQLTEALKTSLGRIKGLTGNGTMSDHGKDKGMQLKAPAGADPQLNQVLDQMKESFTKVFVALPDEPVGAGARWEVKSPVISQGMTINQTTTYELVSIEGEHVTTKTTMVQTAANQKLQNPSMPQLKLDLIKMEGHESGDVGFDLDKPLAPQASLVMHSQVEMKMTPSGQTQPQAVVTKVELNLQLEGK